MKLGVALSIAAVSALVGCGGNPWTTADTTSMTHAVQLGKACDSLCAGDGGCSSEVAAGCFEAMTCNVASSLHRHGAPDLMDGGAGCHQ